VVQNLDRLEVYSLAYWLEDIQIKIYEKNNFLLHDRIHRSPVLDILVPVNVLKRFQVVMKNDHFLRKQKYWNKNNTT